MVPRRAVVGPNHIAVLAVGSCLAHCPPKEVSSGMANRLLISEDLEQHGKNYTIDVYVQFPTVIS